MTIMIFALYGPNIYASRKKLNELVGSFRQKSGSGLAIDHFDAEEKTTADLEAVAGSSSLFQEKKLIVVERFFSGASRSRGTKQLFKEWGEAKETIFIFWDAAPDKKHIAELKELLKYAEKTQEFKEPTPADVSRFIAEYAAENRLRLSSAHQTAILKKFGPDLWGIKNELEKTALAKNHEVPLLRPKEDKVYVFLDLLVEGHPEALHSFFSLREAGIDDFYIWASVVNAIRALTAFSAARSSKDGAARVEKGLRMQPFVAKKVFRQAGRFTGAFLANTHRELFSWDARIKTGGATLEDAVLEIADKFRNVSQNPVRGPARSD